jgi:hypothetical protein
MMFTANLSITFNLHNSNCSLTVALKPKYKESYCNAAILLLKILKKILTLKSCYFTEVYVI